MSVEWYQEMERLDIEIVHSSIRHPEGNPAERKMRIINGIIRLYCYDDHDKWYDLLPHMETCFNDIPHEIVIITPRLAHFGLRSTRSYDEIFPPRGPLVRHEDVIANCRGKIESEAERRKKYNIRKEHQFLVGDKVLLRTPVIFSTKNIINFIPCIRDILSSLKILQIMPSSYLEIMVLFTAHIMLLPLGHISRRIPWDNDCTLLCLSISILCR